MKKFLLIAFFIAASAGFYATPYYSASQMQQAAQANDSSKLNSYIDYPMVKESLKASLHSSIGHSLLKNKTDSGMNAFAAMFAAAFVNPLVDGLVTPENISLMLQANQPSGLQTSKEDNKAEENPQSTTKDDIMTHKYYQDFDHFVIDVASKTEPNKPFRFTFTRQSLVSWKLTGLTIPDFQHDSLK